MRRFEGIPVSQSVPRFCLELQWPIRRISDAYWGNPVLRRQHAAVRAFNQVMWAAEYYERDPVCQYRKLL